MMPSDRIEESIRNVRLTTSEAADARIMNAAEAAMAETGKERPALLRTSGLIRRTIMKTTFTKLATAAVILIAAMLGIYVLTGSVDGTSITMGQIRNAMEGIDWMQIINKGGDENKVRDKSPQIDWFSFGSKVHIGIARDIVQYDDFTTGKRLSWNPAGKHIIEDAIGRNREFAYGAKGPFEMMDKTLLHAASGSDVEKKLGTYQGRRVEVWTASNSVKGRPGYTRTLTVYIDIEKKLPIAATYDHNKPDATVLRESEIEFKFPASGPADIYEAGAPTSAPIKQSIEK